MQRSEIKYRYALDEGRIIDIDSEHTVRSKEYECLSCGNLLIPVLGEIRVRHFRHKVQYDCSAETYLHNLAKQTFFQTYTDCLANNRPFFLEYRVPTRCNACKDHGPCAVGYGMKQTDLTRHFKEIEVEVRDGGFIPDILLRNGNEVLYVEIAVTHFVEENKARSGKRILEISINDQADVDLISSCCISEDDARVTVSNFKTIPTSGDLHKECEKTVHCFILHRSGKSITRSVPAWEYENLVDKGVYVEKVAHSGAEAFVSKVGELFKKGMKIKNCWLCEFHCLHYQTIESYCRLKKESIENNNRAVECDKYKPIKKIPEGGLIKAAEDRLMKSRTQPLPRQTRYAAPLPVVAPEFMDVVFSGYSLNCKCGDELTFIISAKFNGCQECLFITEDGQYYRKSKVDQLLDATACEDHPAMNLGVFVRCRGEYGVQCAKCSEVNSLVNVEFKQLFHREINFDVFKS